MILSYGEILFDVFPSYRRLGGAPFNFAYHIKALGIPVQFLSRIGDDDAGADITAFLTRSGFDLQTVQIDPAHPTGTVDVHMDKQRQPTFQINPDVAYDHIAYTPEVRAAVAAAPDLIYFGTLIQRSAESRQTLASILADRPAGTRVLYDLNLRPGSYRLEWIEPSLTHADVVKISDNEVDQLKEMMSDRLPDAAFIESLMAAYRIDTVALTRGEAGSELFAEGRHVTRDANHVDPLVDPVGAGDAFTAMLAAGLLAGWDPGKILDAASALAARVCEIEGAIPDQPSFYAPFASLMEGAS